MNTVWHRIGTTLRELLGQSEPIMHTTGNAVQHQPPPPPHKNDTELAITNTSLFLDYNSPNLYRCLNHDARRLLMQLWKLVDSVRSFVVTTQRVRPHYFWIRNKP